MTAFGRWLRRITGIATAPPSPRAHRNAPCPCGSGRKYRRCCETRDLDQEQRTRLSEAYSAANRDDDVTGGASAARRGFRSWANLSRLSIRRRMRRDYSDE